MADHAPTDSGKALLSPPWGIIADDLTGACDAAVKFANEGFRTTVIVAPDGELDASADVIAVSTGSRGDEPDLARLKVQASCARFKARNIPVLFKKIDSTLRGNLRTELEAVMKAEGFDKAIVAPSFPEMGRTFRGGRLYVDGARAAGDVHLPALLSEADGFLVPDAETDDDLARIVAEAFRGNEHRPLPAGSGGFASAVARYLRPESAKRSATASLPGPRGPTLFVIGSQHQATQGQVRQFSADAATQVQLDECTPELLEEWPALGKHLIVHVPFHRHPYREDFHIQPEILAYAWGGVCVSGGDTAALLFRDAGVTSLELGGEVLPGIPWGRPSGRRDYPWPVVTKGGSFGEPDALLKVADFLKQA